MLDQQKPSAQIGQTKLMALAPVGDSIWLAEGEIVNFYGFPYPTRSVVIRLQNGDLWIWSPIKLTQDLKDGISRLGRVAHLISPNKLHHLYLKEWKAAYPNAALWGPASTIKKRSDLSFREALTDLPPAEWRDEIDQAWFRGSPALDEIVFFHRLSSTAIIADLSENFDDTFLRAYWTVWKRVIAKIWKITVGYGYAPLEWRLSWIHRAPARQALEKLIGWNPTRVIMAHGAWQRENGRAYLERAFAWLRR